MRDVHRVSCLRARVLVVGGTWPRAAAAVVALASVVPCQARTLLADDAASSRPRAVAPRLKDPEVVGVPAVQPAITVRVQRHQAAERDPVTGLTTAKVPPAVRAQLEAAELSEGFGLVVEEVAPGSAADRAGVKPFDILVTFDDQRLVSSEQLAALARTVEGRQRLPLMVIRGGRTKTLKLRLDPEAVAAAAKASGEAAAADPEPAANQAAAARQPLLNALPPELREFLNNPPFPGLPPGLPPIGNGQRQQSTTSSQSMAMMSTDRGSITLRSQDGSKTVAIQDPSGKEIYAGPLNTPEDVNNVPEAFRDMLQGMTVEP